MYICLQHIWYKLDNIILNRLGRSSIGPRGPSQVTTSTITMIDGVNEWRIIAREDMAETLNVILNFMRSIEFC